VREALKRLEAEGPVQLQRNKGAVVTRISEPELAPIFEVRVMLETQAIRLAVPKLTEAQLRRARAIWRSSTGPSTTACTRRRNGRSCST
jgi:DNA-binding GntR family transcriptional regulator